MPDDLDGSAPDNSLAALLLVDIINDFDYPGGDKLFQNARHIAEPICLLKSRMRKAHIPTIYVNDNFGRWRSSFKDTVTACLKANERSRRFVEGLQPRADDYFVLKPRHSGFYQTPLDILLKHFGTKRLVLAGLCTNSCILATANDAYMRDLQIYVPRDCVAAQSNEEQEYALHHMELMNKADTRQSSELDVALLTAHMYTQRKSR